MTSPAAADPIGAGMGTVARLAEVEIGPAHPVRLVGALNVSPESFYPGSVATDEAALAERARAMVAEGADIIDIGAQSTAPYLATEISTAEERRRMQWALAVLIRAVDVPISADTRRASVAAVALAAGARIVNDTSGLRADPMMAQVAAQSQGLILMAAEQEPTAEPPINLCTRLLRDSLDRAARAGIARERIVLDPGVGFFRHTGRPAHEFDLAVLRDLPHLTALGHPVLVGVSRKSFVGKVTGRQNPADRLWGSLAAAAIAVANGASAVRTHDVAATRDTVRVAARLRQR